MLFIKGSGKNETIRDFARVCGQPFYPFTCAKTMDPVFLTGVFKGLVMTGILCGGFATASLIMRVLLMFCYFECSFTIILSRSMDLFWKDQCY